MATAQAVRCQSRLSLKSRNEARGFECSLSSFSAPVVEIRVIRHTIGGACATWARPSVFFLGVARYIATTDFDVASGRARKEAGGVTRPTNGVVRTRGAELRRLIRWVYGVEPDLHDPLS